MTVRLLKTTLVLSLLASPALLPAQTSGNEEERMEALTRADTANWYRPKSKLTVGFRMLNTGGKVNFANLGNVAYDLTVAPASAGAAERVYDNGAVHLDTLRLDERDANNVQTSTPGGRYPVFATATVDILDGTGTVIGTQEVQIQVGDFLSFTPGLTRNWGYGANSQATADGRIALSTYSATSDGANILKKEGPSAGLEFQFTHTFGQGNKRTQLGLMAGLTLNGINSKSSGTVTSTLNTRTDFYSLNGGTAPAASYLAPTFDTFTDIPSNVATPLGLETTVPIASVPATSTETATPGGATVNGNWQVKGAYFMVRLGPTVHSQLTERLGVSASVGYAVAYAGSTYSVSESFTVPDLPDVLVGAQGGTAYDYAAKYLSGYYADLNLEWAANERTGLFGGLTAQKFDGYDQEVGGRTARIDLGSSVGIRGGISIRF